MFEKCVRPYCKILIENNASIIVTIITRISVPANLFVNYNIYSVCTRTFDNENYSVGLRVYEAAFRFSTRVKYDLWQVLDDCIFAFFALEMVIKMIAMGIYGDGAYLADSWNKLDFFIVFAG